METGVRLSAFKSSTETVIIVGHTNSYTTLSSHRFKLSFKMLTSKDNSELSGDPVPNHSGKSYGHASEQGLNDALSRRKSRWTCPLQTWAAALSSQRHKAQTVTLTAHSGHVLKATSRKGMFNRRTATHCYFTCTSTIHQARVYAIKTKD